VNDSTTTSQTNSNRPLTPPSTTTDHVALTSQTSSDNITSERRSGILSTPAPPPVTLSQTWSQKLEKSNLDVVRFLDQHSSSWREMGSLHQVVAAAPTSVRMDIVTSTTTPRPRPQQEVLVEGAASRVRPHEGRLTIIRTRDPPPSTRSRAGARTTRGPRSITPSLQTSPNYSSKQTQNTYHLPAPMGG